MCILLCVRPAITLFDGSILILHNSTSHLITRIPNKMNHYLYCDLPLYLHTPLGLGTDQNDSDATRRAMKPS